MVRLAISAAFWINEPFQQGDSYSLSIDQYSTMQVQGSLTLHVYHGDTNDALQVTRKLPTILWLPLFKTVRTCLGGSK